MNFCLKNSQIGDYKNTGYTISQNVISHKTCDSWITSLSNNLVSHSNHVEMQEKKRTISAGKGDSIHKIFDRYSVDKILPEINKIYTNLLFNELKAHLKENIILSKYSRSAYYIKFYIPPDGQQGWHYDTNDYTYLIYLTDNEDGHTEVNCLNGEKKNIKPKKSQGLFLNGKGCYHRALNVNESLKAVLILNYYKPNHEPRNMNIDPLIFGK